MSAIQEALQRRAGGAPVAPTDQQMQPTGALPTGGQNMPAGGAAPMPQQAPQSPDNVSPRSGAQDQQMKLANGSLKQLVNLLGNQPDADTAALTKQLINRLVQMH